MAKSKDAMSANDFCFPDPSVKNSPETNVDLGPKCAEGDTNGVAGSGYSLMTPVDNKSTSPIKGDGYGDNKFAARGDSPRFSTSYGK